MTYSFTKLEFRQWPLALIWPSCHFSHGPHNGQSCNMAHVPLCHGQCFNMALLSLFLQSLPSQCFNMTFLPIYLWFSLQSMLQSLPDSSPRSPLSLPRSLPRSILRSCLCQCTSLTSVNAKVSPPFALVFLGQQLGQCRSLPWFSSVNT